MAASKNMTLAEWNALCAEKGLDPNTGGKAGVTFVHFVDTELIAREQDEWMEKMRAQERAIAKPRPKKRWYQWRLKWV